MSTRNLTAVLALAGALALPSVASAQTLPGFSKLPGVNADSTGLRNAIQHAGQPATYTSAAPYLSISEAKRTARKDMRRIASGNSFTLDCFRGASRSRVICSTEIYGGGVTCDASYVWRKDYYGQVLFSGTVSKPDCY